MNADDKLVPREAAELLARRFWELRIFADSLPTWDELDPKTRRSKCLAARLFLATHVVPAVEKADRHETGRRISALRSGLTASRESFDELIDELQEYPPHLAQKAQEARDDVQVALNRELNMRGDASAVKN